MDGFWPGVITAIVCAVIFMFGFAVGRHDARRDFRVYCMKPNVIDLRCLNAMNEGFPEDRP